MDSSFIYRTAGAISIHAPLRERRLSSSGRYKNVNFNPRSLTGATQKFATLPTLSDISIHAPLRERHHNTLKAFSVMLFQSTLPYGSDFYRQTHQDTSTHFNPRSLTGATLSLHEAVFHGFLFQSTLPYGSDYIRRCCVHKHPYFNPRSLTGATVVCFYKSAMSRISIHAPLRERHGGVVLAANDSNFNPRSLTGATFGAGAEDERTCISIHAPLRERRVYGTA